MSRPNASRTVPPMIPCGLAIALLGPAALAAPVSHWTFNGPTPNDPPYANSVAGGPSMLWDAATNAPATFDPEQVRLETFPDPNTRLYAADPSLTLNTFSFSLIIDPTDMKDFGPILNKESAAPDTFADFQRVGWQVQHLEFGNLEFIVRGTDPGTQDFFGVNGVLGTDSGFPAGGNFDSDDRWHIAGGYDAATGAAYFYVTPIGDGTGTVTSLVGNGGLTFAPGAVQDASPLSLGTPKSNGDIVGDGAGFDADDLQIYDRLLTESELLFLANNPGVAIPTPGTIAALALGGVALARRRRD